ncbi:hypothetical protein PV326_003304, partial [Microctonus aethiopoides]
MSQAHFYTSNQPKTLDELSDTISSELDGNPPLWVTRIRRHYHDDIYINNAKILNGSNFKSTIKLSSGETKTQSYLIMTVSTSAQMTVLHQISEVLVPVLSNSNELLIYNPNAFQFINHSDSLNIGKYRTRNFRQRILYHHKEEIFKADGGYTFFIPEEEGFK